VFCLRPGCNNPVPPGRRKYCSAACSRAVNRQKAAAAAHAVRVTAESDNLDIKLRECLSCGAGFLSDGPWNRICSRCKRREGH